MVRDYFYIASSQLKALQTKLTLNMLKRTTTAIKAKQVKLAIVFFFAIRASTTEAGSEKNGIYAISTPKTNTMGKANIFKGKLAGESKIIITHIAPRSIAREELTANLPVIIFSRAAKIKNL